jgi:hypothetical protein
VAKATIVQRDFSRGQISESFLEAKDTDLRAAALRKGLNARLSNARTIVPRPGSTFFQKTDATNSAEIRLATREKFIVLLSDEAYSIVRGDGATVASGPAPWLSAAEVWSLMTGNELILGCQQGIFVLSREAGAWQIEPFAFDGSASGLVYQPYWAFDKNAGVQPSGKTGSITLTAGRPIFTAQHVGVRARYNSGELTITGFLSPTQVEATVVSELPPSFDLTVESAARFFVGEVVEGQDTGYRGVISAIAGNVVSVSTLAFNDGPDVDEKISGPGGSSKITAKSEIPPLPSDVWDEQLISPLRGYPRSATSASGRLIFSDFPQIPDLLAVSSARTIRDFRVGAGDDDAIVRQIGDNTPRIYHVVNKGDVLIFTDRGCYYINVRDNGLLTPATFSPVLFDNRGSSPVRPVAVDDGVVFIEASGQQVSAALLDGNVYLKWSVKTLSNFYTDLIKTPRALAGPELFSEAIDKYVFVINSDGTVAVLSWFTDFTGDSVGFLPWETQGDYVSIFGALGDYYGIFRRDLGDGPELMLEKISPACPMDCCGQEQAPTQFLVGGEPFFVGGEPFLVVPPSSQHLNSIPAQTYMNGLTIGIRQPGEPVPDGFTVGLPFTVRVQPFPVEMIQSPRVGMFPARTIRGAVDVRNAGAFSVMANTTLRRYQHHAFGDEPEDPPPLFTGKKRFIVMGDRKQPVIEIIKDEPGPLEVLAITQEVTY